MVSRLQMHFVAAQDAFADFAIALLSGSVWRGWFHRTGATQPCHREVWKVWWFVLVNVEDSFLVAFLGSMVCLN